MTQSKSKAFLGLTLSAFVLCVGVGAATDAAATAAERSPAVGSAPAATPADSAILTAALRIAQALADPYARAHFTIVVAEAYAAQGFPDQASQAMLEAVAISEGSALHNHILLEAGEACIRGGLHGLACQIAGRMSQGQHAVYLLCATASAQLKAGRREEALAAIEQGRARTTGMPPGEEAGSAWVKLAAVYAQAGMNRESDGALNQAVAEAARTRPALAGSMLLESVAGAYLAAGRADDALRTAEAIAAGDVKVPLLCSVAQAYAQKNDAERSAAVLEQAQISAEALSDPYQQSAVLAGVADSWRVVGRPDRAKEALRSAEKSAGRVAEPLRGAAACDKVAVAYTAADDLQSAERVIRAGGDPARRAEQLANLALEYAKRGRYEQAVATIKAAEPKLLALVGGPRLTGLADAYFRAWGARAPQEKIAAIQPAELRDAVLARYADALAAEKDYAKAVGFAQAISFAVTRDDALTDVATRCLVAADSAQSAGPAFELLGKLQGRLDKLKLRSKLAAKQVALGLKDDAIASLRSLKKDAEAETVYSAQAEILGEVALGFQKLGRPEDARDTAAKAIAAALKVACAGCRDDTVQDLFKRLSGADYVELALAAGREIDLPDLRADNFIHMFEANKDLTPAQGEKLLREALVSASQASTLSKRAPLLVRVAACYRKAGLQVTEAEHDLLRKSYESIPVVAKPERKPPPATPEGAAAPGQEPEVTHLVYFDRPGCKLCDEVKAAFKDLRTMYPALIIDVFDLTTSESAQLLNAAICTGLNMPEQQRLIAPSIFSSAAGLVGSDISLASMAELTRRAASLPSPVTVFGPHREEARSQIAQAYERLGLLVVAWAGLTDGIINPCAFTVIIFFLAYLAHIGKSRREIATAGIVFTAAVFLTYFGAGLGMAWLMAIVKKWSRLISLLIYAGTAGLALLAAVLSFRDGVQCLKGHTGDLTLGLPEFLKRRIRLTISKRARLGLTVVATLVLGAVVALFELPCTGQMYLPVIVFGLKHLSQPVWGPLGWLLLYNLCFIAPLIVLFVAVFFGLTSERLTGIFRRHIATTKFAMGAVFAALFAVMIVYLF
jgi:hypothetical protein